MLTEINDAFSSDIKKDTTKFIAGFKNGVIHNKKLS